MFRRHPCRIIDQILAAAHEDSTIWKDYQQALNFIYRQINLANLSYQVQLVDDNKEHFESVNMNIYENVTIKK